MATFSRFGVPDTLVTDNGPCFASTEFAKFVDQWNFQHVTSSPRYPQSNAKAENAVRTVERLFTKCRAAGVSEFQALLDWRNTPSEGMDTSPAQRLLGRRCKTLLPTSGFLLTPEFSLINDAAKLCARKDRQRRYFNRGKRVLSPVRTGETIRVRSPSGTWRPAECLREVAPRSYEVLVDGAVRRRNRKDIWRTAEPQNVQACEEVEPFAEVQRAPVASPGPVPETPLVSPAPTPIEADCVGESASPSPVMSPSSVPEVTAQPHRRSTRQRRPPARFKDFIMS